MTIPKIEAVDAAGRHTLDEMAVDFQGEIPAEIRERLEEFAARLTQHPVGGVPEGRLIVPEMDHRGPIEAIEPALAKWMKPNEYGRWRSRQAGRPVTTFGKTFVANDDIVTAVVMPATHAEGEFLAMAAHELIELAELAENQEIGWTYPKEARELHGIIYLDEYRTERVCREIITELGWPENRLERDPGLADMVDQIAELMPDERYNPPPDEFWQYWVHMAQLWAMVLGRGDAGGDQALAELERFASRQLIADNGWETVAGACRDLWDQTEVGRDELVAQAASRIWDPIERFGRDVWDT